MSRQKPSVHRRERRMKNHIEYLCTNRDFWHRGNKEGAVEDRPANSEYLRIFGSMWASASKIALT